jgi:CDGSH-type Zn-finger protein
VFQRVAAEGGMNERTNEGAERAKVLDRIGNQRTETKQDRRCLCRCCEVNRKPWARGAATLLPLASSRHPPSANGGPRWAIFASPSTRTNVGWLHMEPSTPLNRLHADRGCASAPSTVYRLPLRTAELVLVQKLAARVALRGKPACACLDGGPSEPAGAAPAVETARMQLDASAAVSNAC